MRLPLLLLACFAAMPAFSQSFFVRFPDDLFVTHCTDGSNFNEPIIYNPDSLAIVMDYWDNPIIVPDACLRLDRYWQIYNTATYNPSLACLEVPNPQPFAMLQHPGNFPGPVISSIDTLGHPWSATLTKILPTDTVLTNYRKYWYANVNCYSYKQEIKIFELEPPLLYDCFSDAPVFSDTTSNNQELWPAGVWWDPPANSHDLRETPVDLTIAAYDSCFGVNVMAYFKLYLDLDQDGNQETAIDSRNLPPPGIIFFGNAQNPNFSGGIPQQFDVRIGIDSLSRYRFALERVWNSNPQEFNLRWKEQITPDSAVYSIPQLPPGKHSIKWYVQDNCGNETLCNYTFKVQGGVVAVHDLSKSVQLLRTTPNPFGEKTTIRFDLQKASPVRLQVWNTAGRQIFEKTTHFGAGEQMIALQKTDFENTAGLYWFSLETDHGQAFGKIILLP